MNRTHTMDPCVGDGTCLLQPAEFVRLRYFFGQRLGVVDLADEQSYLVGKQRFHNLRLHGAGVLCGLRAERYVYPQGSAETNPTTLLRVRRGAALDGCGREIVVGWDQCIDVAAWYAQHPEAMLVVSPGAAAPSSLLLWVALCYRECPSDPSPAPRDPCGCDAGGCEYARIREGFELKLLTDAEAKLLAPKHNGREGGGLISNGIRAEIPDEIRGEVGSGLSERAYARMVSLFAGADCPEPPADPCLVLANFQATLDPSVKKVIDITAPDNAIPERRSLLPTEVLQELLLSALAAASDAEMVGSGPRFSAITCDGAVGIASTLSIEILVESPGLSRDPFTPGPSQLEVKVFRFQDDGTWVPASSGTTIYISSPPHIEIHFAAGILADGARYRVLIEADPAQPPVDTKMRPLTPLRWARHFRLENQAGKLVLADSLYP